MAFTLAPGEEVRAELSLEDRRGGFFRTFTPSSVIRVTNFRFSVTESLKRGSDTTRYIPLEHIIYVQEGSYSTPRYLWFAIACGVLGVVATLTVVGIIVAVPLFILGVVFLFRYWRSRAQTLLVQSGGEDITVVLGGDAGSAISGRSGGIQEIVDELEQARLERTAHDYYASAIASKAPLALPESQ